MRELPGGDVTFMFTDIEGSTRLFHRLGEDYREVLEAHNRILRHAISANGGAEVKTEGDAFFAAFPSAVMAASAALEAHAGIGQHPWPADIEIRIRIGIHTGHAEPADGDYVALPVNLAARIEGAANGGQTLLSDATVALLREWRGGSLKLLGRFWLKDFDEPQALYALGPGGGDRPEAHAAPRARPADVNLPEILDGVIGRERDEKGIADLFQSARIVTIVGPGGMGKTTLAVATARALLPAFREGVWFVDLAAVSTDDAVVATVSEVLGVPERSIDAIVASIGDSRGLLVLDNCEHVLKPAAALAGAVANHCPAAAVLATSRERLRVKGEHVWPLRGLETPSRDVESPEVLTDSPAVRLFLDRAAAQSGFSLGPEDVTAVRDICIALDGMPLAIALASARLSVLTPRQLLERLDRQLSVLGSRGDGRQDTLRSLLDWSYELLDERERTTLRRMGAITGAVPLEVVGAVVGIDDDIELLDTIGALVEKSLVERGDHEEAGRFRLLETIRQYAAERLAEAGEADPTRERLVESFTALARSVRRGDRAVFVAEHLRAEREALRAAFLWAVDSGRDQLALELAEVAAPAWDAWGDWDLRRPLVALLERTERSHPSWAHAAAAAAWLHYRARDLDAVLAMSDAVLDTHPQRHDLAVASARHLRALMALPGGDVEEARRLVDEAAAAFEAAGVEQPALHNVRAQIAGEAGDLDAARRHVAEGVAVSGADDLATPGLLLLGLGRIELEHGDLEEARLTLDRCLPLARRLGWAPRLQAALGLLATVETAAGNFEVAAELVDEALSLHVPEGPSSHMLLAAAEVAAHDGRAEDALRWVREADRLPYRRGPYVRARLDAVLRSIGAL